MKKQVSWEDFLNPEKHICIQCETKEQAERFFELLQDKKVTWWSGGKVNKKETEWDACKKRNLLCNRLLSTQLCRP